MKKLIKRILRESVNQMIVEEQLLTENKICNPGTEGTSCSDWGHIWCQFAEGARHGHGGGCFCVTPKQCNQWGTNEVCDMVRAPNSPACKPGGGKQLKPLTDKLKSRDRLNVPMSRDNDKMMREREDLELEPSLERAKKRCYKCFGKILQSGRGIGRCKQQQFDLNGKCVDGWKSLNKCNRKCKKKWMDNRGPSEPLTQSF
jgi:hypothetical protein